MPFIRPIWGKRFIVLVMIFLPLIPVFAAFTLHSTAESVQPEATLKDYVPTMYKPEPTALPPDTLSLEPYAGGINTDAIVFIVNAGDPRLFVGEQEGEVRIIDGAGNLLPTPFLDIEDRVRTTNWEEGVLGMVFHPDYASNGIFYLSYNVNTGDSDDPLNGKIRVSRFQVSSDPNIADPNSETVLLEIKKPFDPDLPFSGGAGPSPVHNGGDMHFGPDSYLYISTGDGGPDPDKSHDPVPGDPYNNSQRTDLLLGKMLRIDVNSASGNPPDCGIELGGFGNHYTIPPDNPFVNDPAKCGEIWAYGLRNPWRFSFDQLTGDMYIADVGEWEREEVNFQPAGSPGGQNYGWHCWEGTYDHTHIGDYCDEETFTFPVFEYDSSDGFCSIIGGYVYRGSRIPGLHGYYLFTDLSLCKFPPIWLLKRDAQGQWQALTRPPNIYTFWSTFGEGYDGELYLSYYQNGSAKTIYRVTAP